MDNQCLPLEGGIGTHLVGRVELFRQSCEVGREKHVVVFLEGLESVKPHLTGRGISQS